MNTKPKDFDEIAKLVGCEVCAAELTGYVPSVAILRCELHQKTELAKVVENLAYNQWELKCSRKQDRR